MFKSTAGSVHQHIEAVHRSRGDDPGSASSAPSCLQSRNLNRCPLHAGLFRICTKGVWQQVAVFQSSRRIQLKALFEPHLHQQCQYHPPLKEREELPKQLRGPGTNGTNCAQGESAAEPRARAYSCIRSAQT